jgi:hypothetical protein
MPAAEHPYLVGPALAFLHLHLQWAANHHPGFPDFTEDLRRLRGALEAATGTNNPPDRAEAPCIDCGDTLTRTYREPWYRIDPDAAAEQRTGRDAWGREDDWTCRGCHRTYDPAEYTLACAQHANTDQALGDWIPLTQAAEETRVPYRTLQTWCRRGHLTHRTNVAGVLEVRQRQVRQVARDRAAKAG